ncbi:TPA: O86 family O-antigen polymerase, partial [Escherichia coli]|nr:O86 family O-antigen polymerase [Escherichia coli]
LSVINEGFCEIAYVIISVSSVLFCVIIICLERQGGFLNPMTFCIISVFFFILIRPVFFSQNITENLNEVITAGLEIDEIYVFYSLAVVNISLAFTVLLYSVQKGTVSKLVGQLPDLFFY